MVTVKAVSSSNLTKLHPPVLDNLNDNCFRPLLTAINIDCIATTEYMSKLSIFQYLTGGSRPLLQKLYNKSAAVRKGQKYSDQVQTEL